MNTEAKIRDFFMNLGARTVRGHKIRKMKRKFRRACRLADDKHACDNKTYYVIQGDGFYKVWNSDEIQRMKRQGAIRKSVHCLDILERSSYAASSNKSLILVPRKVAFANENARINKAY